MRRGGGFSGHGAFSGESKIDLDVEPILDCCFRCCDLCDWDFDDMCWPAKMKKPFMSYIDTDTIFIWSISKQLLLVPLKVQYKYTFSIFSVGVKLLTRHLQKESKLYLITSSCYFPLWNRLPGFINTNINLLLDQVQVVMKCLSILVVFVGRRHNWLWWWWWWHGNVFLNWGWSWIFDLCFLQPAAPGPGVLDGFSGTEKTTDQYKEQGKDKGKS